MDNIFFVAFVTFVAQGMAMEKEIFVRLQFEITGKKMK